jgi:glyoxylase-like metal-dependent hydrolase (beta-lactamase superfamily II)
MSAKIMRLAAVLLVLGSFPLLAAESLEAYDVVRLADGVYGVVWKTRPVSPEPNILFAINDDDVLVVDSGLLPSSARTVIREIRKLTPKPVRYLVNTHWHDDHVNANFVYRKEWPGVQIISHPNTRIDAHARAFGGKEESLAKNRAGLEKYEGILRAGKKSDNTPLDGPTRARVEEVVAFFRRYVEEIPSVEEVLPNITVDQSLVLHCGSRVIEVHYLGRGNTRGDVVVWLPNEKILVTGDLVVSPTPFGFGSYYAEWIGTLDKLMQFDATTLFLAHGDVQHDFGYVRQEQGLLRALVDRVGAEVAKGSSLDDVKKAVTLDDWKKTLAGNDPMIQLGFDQFFVAPAVERAYDQAKGDQQ